MFREDNIIKLRWIASSLRSEHFNKKMRKYGNTPFLEYFFSMIFNTLRHKSIGARSFYKLITYLLVCLHILLKEVWGFIYRMYTFRTWNERTFRYSWRRAISHLNICIIRNWVLQSTKQFIEYKSATVLQLKKDNLRKYWILCKKIIQ